MPRILRAGAGYDTRSKWWSGTELTCDRCRCRFMLVPEDTVKTTDSQMDGEWGEYPCPECQNRVTFSSLRISHHP